MWVTVWDDEGAWGTLSTAGRLTWLGHTQLAVLKWEGRQWASNEYWRVEHRHGTIIKEENPVREVAPSP